MQAPPPSYQSAVPPQQQPPYQQPPILQQPQAVNIYQNENYLGMTKAHTIMLRFLNKNLGPEPVNIICPNCQANVTTETKKIYGTCQWITSVMLCSFFLFIFAWIPFVVDSWKDTVHSCPRCKAYCGFQRLCSCGY